MASRVSLTLFVLGHGCHGLSSRQSNAYLPFRSSILPPISCKMRPRNFSSHNRRQQMKKAPRRNPPLDAKYPPREDEGADTEKAVTETVSESYQDTQSDEGADSNAVIKNSNGADFGNSDLSVETKSLSESGIGGEQISNIRLEDLIGMIKNAEKNVMLLNEARVRAIEDLDKILTEKEALQGQINTLEMRLAEADARIKVAAQEKIHVELLEDKLEKLKIEMSERDQGSEYNLYEDRKRNLIVKSPLSDASGFTSLSKELDLVRRENMELKDDMQTLERMLNNVKETGERVLLLEKERSSLEATLKELESRVTVAQEDVSKLSTLKYECKVLQENVENLQGLLDKATKQADQAILVVHQNHDLQKKVDRLEESLEKVSSNEYPLESSHQFTEHLQQKVILLEEHLQKSDEEIHSHVQMYHESVREFQDTVNRLKEESKRRAQDEPVEDMPWEFWSRLLITFDGWLLEKKISSEDAKFLRDLTWKRDARIRDTYFACKDKGEHVTLATFLKLVSSRTWAGLHVIHIAAEMAPVAKVGGLGDVVSGLSKALQKKGHLVEIVLPKYDCMQYDRIGDLKVLDVVVQSYFDGHLFSNKVWVGTVEGLPVQLRWRVCDCHPGGVNAISFSEHGPHIYTAGVDGMVCQIDSMTGSLLRKFRSSTKAVSSISISPDGKILATAAGQLKIFNCSDFKKMQKFSGHPAAVRCMIFTEDGKYILSSAVGERYIAVWKIDGGRKQPVSCVLSMDHPAVFLDSKGTDNGGAVNDGLFVLAISELGLCYFWHGRNIEELRSMKPTKISLSLEGPLPKYQKSSIPTIFAAKLQGIVKLGSAQVSVAYGSVVKPSFEKLLVQHGENVDLSRSWDGVLLPMDQSAKSKKRQVSRTEVTALDRANAEDAMLPIAKLHDYHEKKRKHSMQHSALEEAMADVTIDNKSEVKAMDYEDDSDKTEEDAGTICMEDRLRSSGLLGNVDDLRRESFPEIPSGSSLKSTKLKDDHLWLEAKIPEKKIKEAVSAMSPTDAYKFLTVLVTTWKLRSGSGKYVLPWIRSILANHSHYAISQEPSTQMLGTLHEMTKSKCSAIQPLLQLSGRLKLISTQINKAGESTIQAFSDDHQVDESGDEDEDIVELVYGEEEGSESGSDADN